jgi:hypothetical protein
MPCSLGNSQVYRQIIRTVGSSSVKEGISVEILFMVAIPAPAGIRIRIAAETLAVVYSFTLAVTDFDAMMTGTGVVTGTVHGDRELVNIAEDAHFGRLVHDTTGKEFLKDFFRTLLPEFFSLRQRSKFNSCPGMFWRKFLAGLELHTWFGAEGLWFKFTLYMLLMR